MGSAACSTLEYKLAQSITHYMNKRVSGGSCSVPHIYYHHSCSYRNPYNFTEPYSIYNASEQLPISSNADDKTNHEVYLWSFAEAVRAGTTHVMCSYNMINGTHSCANSVSNNRLLKDELNFQGALISDWGGAFFLAHMSSMVSKLTIHQAHGPLRVS